MEVRQTFAPGQGVTVLACEEVVFVGTIVSCNCKFECEVCDDRPCPSPDWHDKDKGKDKDKDKDCDRFLVLKLDEDVKVDYRTVFEEDDTVFISFCQICAISCGFPPKKKMPHVGVTDAAEDLKTGG